MTKLSTSYFTSYDEVWSKKKLSKRTLDKLVNQILKQTNKEYIKSIAIEILYLDDSSIKVINREKRGIDRPTNVLSFENKFEDRSVFLNGSVIFSFSTIKREADFEKKSFRDHLIYLFVHGFLHILGYDHQDDDEAFIMEGLEKKIIENI